jgi:hypothetical protein
MLKQKKEVTRIRAFADELKSEFPGTDPYDGEFINTGISIPFYGATKGWV